MQRILLLSLTNQFLDKEANLPPPPSVQIGCKNSPIYIGLNKNYSGKMLIVKIIEFQLRELGPPGRTWVSITGQFHDKTKTSKENLRVNYYLLLKYCTRQCTVFPPT